MSIEQNKTTLWRWMEAWNTGSVSGMETLAGTTYASDFVIHNNAQPAAIAGCEGVKQFVRTVFQNTPDIRVTVEDMIAEGDKVVVQATIRGTSASTGKPANLLLVSIYRFAGGLIAEEWMLTIPAAGME